ncbi:unnamed protein product [Urochloa decumbens]|uniref:SAP domain-containing protein n=1 Tax=Urochloa decumbens TaxID=240449 RepID=A0ABC8W7E7_9POAL
MSIEASNHCVLPGGVYSPDSRSSPPTKICRSKGGHSREDQCLSGRWVGAMRRGAGRGGMEFAEMKRRELLELCRQHGLATRGSKADLAASLAGAISDAAAAAAESVVEVVVGKGCLKRLGGSASDGTSGAAKKVRFALDEESEERARRRRSQLILQPVVTKTRGKRKARKIHPPAAVSGRGQRRKCGDVVGNFSDEDVTGEVGAVGPVTRSTMKAMCLCAHSEAENQNNSAETEKGREVVEAAIDRKQRQKTQENAMVLVAISHKGISREITQSSSSSSAAVLVCPSVEKKIGRRKKRDVAEEQAAEVQDLTTSTSLVIIKSRSSRNGEYYHPSAQKSPKVVISCRTRSSSLAATVIFPTDIGYKCRKTRGRPRAKEVATVVSRRGSQRKRDVGDDYVGHVTSGEVGADAPVTQPRTEAMNLCAEIGVESQNNSVDAEEEQVVGAAFDSRKRKQKAQENAESTSVNALAGVSLRRKRKSSLSASAVVENKRGRRKVGDYKGEPGAEEQAAQVQDLATTASPVVENERNRGMSEDGVPAVQKSGRTTRAQSVAAATMLPIVTRNEVRKAEDVHPDVELPADLEVPRVDAPVTRSLRNRIIQVYNGGVEETHVGEKLEDKRKPGRPSTRRHQQLASSVKEGKQVAAPCELPALKQSMSNHPEADELVSSTNLETKKLCGFLVAKDLKIVHPLTLHTTNTSVENVVAKAEKEMGFTKSRSEDKRKNECGVSVSVENDDKASTAKTELGVLDERTTGMHESVMDFQSVKGGDVGKQSAVRGAVRRSTRRCVLAGRI